MSLVNIFFNKTLLMLMKFRMT